MTTLDYIEHFQRRRSRKYLFRTETLNERVGRFLIETGVGQDIQPRKALLRALHEGDIDVAVQIADRLLVRKPAVDVRDRPAAISGEFEV